MKKLSKIMFAALAAFSFVAVSCSEKEMTHEPSEPDVDGCYGVYFPSQEASGSHTYDPTMDPVVDFKVARRNTKGAITVPVVAETSSNGIFEVGTLSFADGQSESTLEVKFPNAEMATTYSLSLTVSDPQYASRYLEGATSIDFDVMRVQWNYFLNPKTGEKALVTWDQSWWGETATGYVKYYEVDGVRHCQTETISHEYNGKAYTGYGFWGQDDDAASATEWSFIWYTNMLDNNGSQMMELPTQRTGYYHSSYAADVMVFDVWNYYNSVGGYSYDWQTYAAKYSKDPDGDYPVSYYDGNGGFYLCAWRYYMYGIGGWNPGSYDTVGIAEGFVRTDYTLEAEAYESEDGVLPIDLTLGADVASVKYAAYEGTLTETQVSNKVSAIEAGTDASTVADLSGKTLDEDTALYTASIGATLPATGKYTLVFVGYNANGVASASTSVEACYVAAGESVPVVLSLGIGSAEKYKGVNTDNSLEIYLYGEDLTDVKAGVFKAADFRSNVSACIKAVKASSSVSASVLEEINGDGYVAVASGLLPGTEYAIIAWASNGYQSKSFISTTTCYTTGDPLPIYQTYTSDDFASEYAAANDDAIIGKTYNCYATNLWGSLGLNEYIGKVTISDSETADEGPDSYGYNDEYVVLKGLAGPYATKYSFDDALEFDLYAGALYKASKTNVSGNMTVYEYETEGDGVYNRSYDEGFIPVADGYFAMVDLAGYTGYNFCGLYYATSAGGYAAYSNYILVDPAKDDNGLAPTSKSTISPAKSLTIANAKMAAQKAHAVKAGKAAPTMAHSFKAVDPSSRVAAPVSVKSVKVAAKKSNSTKVLGRNTKPSKETLKELAL